MRMGGPTPRRGPRPSHTRDEIARVAVSSADSKGLAAVSIRAVAYELGAGAASLYRYIESKDDLFDLMVDAVSADYALPKSPSGDWRADIALIAQRGRTVHRQHGWASTLAAHAAWGPNVQTFLEFFLASLKPMALDAAEHMEFIGLLNSFMASFAAFERQQRERAERPADPGAQIKQIERLQQIAANSQLPHLAAAVTAMMQAAPTDANPDQLFTRGLNRLLDTIPVAPRSST
jgi:AcrR family transcriptional regulator